jgi:hypothetical protein
MLRRAGPRARGGHRLASTEQKATSSELLTALTVTSGQLIPFSLSRAGRTSIAP